MAERVRRELFQLGEFANAIVLFLQSGLLDVAGFCCGRKNPSVLCDSFPRFKALSNALRQRNSPASTRCFSEQDVKRPTANVLASEPEAFLRAQGAVDKDDGNISKQEWVLGLDWDLPTHRTYPVQSLLIPLFEGPGVLRGGIQVSRLFILPKNPFAVVLARKHFDFRCIAVQLPHSVARENIRRRTSSWPLMVATLRPRARRLEMKVPILSGVTASRRHDASKAKPSVPDHAPIYLDSLGGANAPARQESASRFRLHRACAHLREVVLGAADDCLRSEVKPR